MFSILSFAVILVADRLDRVTVFGGSFLLYLQGGRSDVRASLLAVNADAVLDRDGVGSLAGLYDLLDLVLRERVAELAAAISVRVIGVGLVGIAHEHGACRLALLYDAGRCRLAEQVLRLLAKLRCGVAVVVLVIVSHKDGEG